MVADSFSTSLVNPLPQIKKPCVPKGYFRSKLYISPSSSNPLLSAAGPIFSLLERLSVSPRLPDIDDIYQNVEHEINAFHSRLSSLDYTDELSLVARYLLSATVDEMLGKNYMRTNGQPAEFKAFPQFANDEIGPEKRFFQIVDYIKARPSQYLDLVELSYYCLISGFEGAYHLKPDGRVNLDNAIEELYQLIQSHRVHKPIRLFSVKNPISSQPKSRKTGMIFGFLAVGGLVLLYYFSQAVLEYKAQKLLNENTTLTSLER